MENRGISVLVAEDRAEGLVPDGPNGGAHEQPVERDADRVQDVADDAERMRGSRRIVIVAHAHRRDRRIDLDPFDRSLPHGGPRRSAASVNRSSGTSAP